MEGYINTGSFSNCISDYIFHLNKLFYKTANPLTFFLLIFFAMTGNMQFKEVFFLLNLDEKQNVTAVNIYLPYAGWYQKRKSLIFAALRTL